ncbi:MAG TPA: prolyl oligopeptidase family serine peptidase [Gemmatales bacterium]|nr:prolyl oligopeptidase family serine peptidase [Gemmatales bacterium]
MYSLILLLLSYPSQPADAVKPFMPPGIKISDADRAELTKAAAEFEQEINAVRKELQGQPLLLDLLPDVLIYHKAVDWALKYDEFFDAREVKAARTQLSKGRERLAQIKANKPDYLHQTGLIVRGYVSKIDGSVQPYGLVVPASYTPKTLSNYRLDVWLHGRGDKLTELSFIDGRQRSPGEFTPKDAFVLHPYGRYCNAYKFAGEVDVFEALEHCKKHYRIDDKRLVVRGFSMGGAACWHLAVHHPGIWCAASPGAGFAETPEYSKMDQDKVPPTWWEKKLWHLYNATDYAENLKNLPTIAYSGEIDKQKQAADVMAREMEKFGLKLRHIIGPKMGHKYDAESKKEIERIIEGHMNVTVFLPELHFTTYTLRYQPTRWLRIEGMDEQWKKARVQAKWCFNELTPGYTGCGISTSNVSAIFINLDPFHSLGLTDKAAKVNIDGQVSDLIKTQSDGSLSAHFRKEAGKWKLVDKLDDGKLHKKPGLQGPIDDAFMDSFLIVKPNGTSPYAKVNEWVDAEMNRAIDQWRKQFRGVPRVKFDKDVTEADIANHHLILWGLPESNSVMKKLADKLPIKWADGKLQADKQSYDANTHAPILIYPNPLNPNKYVVLNSGFTFAGLGSVSNARQVPLLPDWAIVDITSRPSPKWPGKVIDAGFFGEHWQWKSQ